MDKLISYGITRRALQLLQPSAENPSSIPKGWFNWLNPNIGGRAVERLQYLDPELNGNQVVEWNKAAIQAGYGCMLIYSLEDPAASTAHAEGLSGDVVIYPISHMPTLAEMEREPALLVMLREPEEFFRENWCSILDGANEPLTQLGLKNVSPSQWWAYGLGLASWIALTTMGEPGARYRTHCLDFKIWNHLKLDGYDWPDTKLNLEETWGSKADDSWRWSLSNPCTESTIAEMSCDGFVAFYPMRQMPCCGVAVPKSGALVPIGALTSDWAWATEETVAVFEMIRKERQARAPQKPPRPWVTAITDSFRLLASYVYTPQPLGAADGRFIPVEVLECNMRVELWIDTNENEGKTAFVVTPYWQETPEKLLRIEVIFDGEPATMEVNGLTSTLLNLQGQDQIEGVFLTTPSLHIEVRIYAAD